MSIAGNQAKKFKGRILKTKIKILSTIHSETFTARNLCGRSNIFSRRVSFTTSIKGWLKFSSR
jgi:hypothetical protein